MNETIGNRIAKFRKGKGMTQERLASQLGISSLAVSKWETEASLSSLLTNGRPPVLAHLMVPELAAFCI